MVRAKRLAQAESEPQALGAAEEAVLAVSGPLLITAVMTYLAIAVQRGPDVIPRLHYFWFRFWPIGEALALGLWAIWLVRFRKSGLLSVGLGMLLVVFVELNFRGAYIRFGTFELFSDSRDYWFRPWLIGAGVGAAIGQLWMWVRPSSGKAESTGWLGLVAGVLVILVAVVEWVLVAGLKLWSYSAFPPTKQWAYLALGLMAVGVMSVLKWRESYA